MDLHINDLKVEEGFRHVRLDEVSFRDIDQELVIFETDETFNSTAVNELYYCYIRPYEGIFFRFIGRSDENAMLLFVDEGISESDAKDRSYSEVKSYMFSKILENGDLISNQQIMNLGFDYYEDQNLLETRTISWIDSKRIKGNPDVIEMVIDGNPKQLSLKAIRDEKLLCNCGQEAYAIKKDLSVERVESI